MDFHLKQWKAQQQESDTTGHQVHSKLALFENQTDGLHHSNSTLPLFVPAEEEAPSLSSRFPTSGMGSSSNFSWVQWQELELQALIYRYMIAGAAVPPELLQPIKKSLLHSPYFMHYSGQYQLPSALVHSGYWGRGSMDPEPGRCRRTDGKKWRCSRDVVGGQKYCERHMHRGRNRSRKPVEVPVASSFEIGNSSGGGGTLSGSSSQSIDLFQSYSSETKPERNDVSDGRVLRHFFDDWPRSVQDSDKGTCSSTSLSISLTRNHNASDVSLKLYTGIGDETEQQQMGNWEPSRWGPNQGVGSMGGPLAEALRSSAATSQSSPTSVLPRRGSRPSEVT